MLCHWHPIHTLSHQDEVQNMLWSHQVVVFTPCWYDWISWLKNICSCGVNNLCYGTKHVHLGVNTTDGCKNAEPTFGRPWWESAPWTDPNSSIHPSEKNMWNDHTTRCDHSISSKWTFDHTKNVLITPSKFWSHRQIFDHTVYNWFTLWRFYSHRQIVWSHRQIFWSHRIHFVHTVQILFTPSNFLFTPSIFKITPS